VLCLVADSLAVTTLTLDDYDLARDEMRRIAGNRWLHGEDRSYLSPPRRRSRSRLTPRTAPAGTPP